MDMERKRGSNELEQTCVVVALEVSWNWNVFRSARKQIESAKRRSRGSEQETDGSVFFDCIRIPTLRCISAAMNHPGPNSITVNFHKDCPCFNKRQATDVSICPQKTGLTTSELDEAKLFLDELFVNELSPPLDPRCVVSLREIYSDGGEVVSGMTFVVVRCPCDANLYGLLDDSVAYVCRETGVVRSLPPSNARRLRRTFRSALKVGTFSPNIIDFTRVSEHLLCRLMEPERFVAQQHAIHVSLAAVASYTESYHIRILLAAWCEQHQLYVAVGSVKIPAPLAHESPFRFQTGAHDNNEISEAKRNSTSDNMPLCSKRRKPRFWLPPCMESSGGRKRWAESSCCQYPKDPKRPPLIEVQFRVALRESVAQLSTIAEENKMEMELPSSIPPVPILQDVQAVDLFHTSCAEVCCTLEQLNDAIKSDDFSTRECSILDPDSEEGRRLRKISLDLFANLTSTRTTFPLPPSQVKRNLKNHLERVFPPSKQASLVRGQFLPNACTEDMCTEFKDLSQTTSEIRTQDPNDAKRILHWAYTYPLSFLNNRGGILCYGVRDDRMIAGAPLLHLETLRRAFAKSIPTIYPRVPSSHVCLQVLRVVGETSTPKEWWEESVEAKVGKEGGVENLGVWQFVVSPTGAPFHYASTPNRGKWVMARYCASNHSLALPVLAHRVAKELAERYFEDSPINKKAELFEWSHNSLLNIIEDLSEDADREEPPIKRTRKMNQVTTQSDHRG